MSCRYLGELLDYRDTQSAQGVDIETMGSFGRLGFQGYSLISNAHLLGLAGHRFVLASWYSQIDCSFLWVGVGKTVWHELLAGMADRFGRMVCRACWLRLSVWSVRRKIDYG